MSNATQKNTDLARLLALCFGLHSHDGCGALFKKKSQRAIVTTYTIKFSLVASRGSKCTFRDSKKRKKMAVPYIFLKILENVARTNLRKSSPEFRKSVRFVQFFRHASLRGFHIWKKKSSADPKAAGASRVEAKNIKAAGAMPIIAFFCGIFSSVSVYHVSENRHPQKRCHLRCKTLKNLFSHPQS